VHQTLTSIPLVQAFGTEDWNQQRFGNLVNRAVQVAQQGTLLSKSFSLISGLATTVSLALVLFVGGQRVLSGAISVGSLVVFLAYVRTLQQATTQLLNTYVKVKTTEASLERVFEIMDSRDEVVDAAFPKDLGEWTGPAAIRFENVSVGYESGSPVLHDVSAEILPGEKVAVVGSTGAGKTTLLSLIPRFRDVWHGRVLFNGIEVRDVSLDSLRSQITIVPQEPFLLPLSIAENIRYANPQATRDQIVEAAKAAQAHDFIEKLPLGYDTELGQRGATLSGGERQRLAIARALVRPASVVILDEPTSALDAETEHALMAAMDLLRSRATLLIIAHRLSTIRNADRVLVLEHGRLVETGSPEELFDRRGTFFALKSPSLVIQEVRA
jgi:ATP-binding cassette subfamily B protein/subfamily B ATP-binding cassette protein MsbA